MWEPDQRILDICDEYGIREPARTIIAKMDVPPDYVLGHIHAAPNVAMAIHRIINRWRVPQIDEENGDRQRSRDKA